MNRCCLRLTLLAATFLLVGTLVGAAERKGSSDSSGAKGDSDALRKYDKNGNGKLDPDEEAAMKADQEKAKRAKKK